MTDNAVMDDVDQLLGRIGALRRQIEEIGMAALAAEPTKPCLRSISGLLDSINGLEALLNLGAMTDSNRGY